MYGLDLFFTAAGWILSGFLTLYGLYFVWVFLASRKKKTAENPEKRKPECTRFAVVIAARNEEQVIGGLVRSLLEQTYPKNLYDVYVVPNNCNDQTEEVARKSGASILHCTVPVHSKGEVLRFAFSRLMEQEPQYDAFCVFDADNRADDSFLSEMDQAFQKGCLAAQGYRESKNPYDSWTSACYSLYFRMMNEYINRPRSLLHMPIFISGTGFAVHRQLLEAEGGWNTNSITEDCEFSCNCILRGVRVQWVPGAVTYDEQPVSFRPSIVQRRRWSSGMMGLQPLYVPQFARSLRKRGLRRDAWEGMCFLCAPVVQVLSWLPCLCFFLGAIFAAPAESVFSLFLGHILVSRVCSMLGASLLAAAAAGTGDSFSKKIWKGVLTYGFFLEIWTGIHIFSLFRRTKAWKEIQHTGGCLSSARRQQRDGREPSFRFIK